MTQEDWNDIWSLCNRLFSDVKNMSLDEQAVYRTSLQRFELQDIKAGLYFARRKGRYLSSPEKIIDYIKDYKDRRLRQVEEPSKDESWADSYRNALRCNRPSIYERVKHLDDDELYLWYLEWEYLESKARYGEQYPATVMRKKRLDNATTRANAKEQS
jgi:hypothetical protein